MKKDMTLVILAAGMGSRFGGLKQIEPVGPNGEFIIDYSIYDAIRAGFNKVVFIIKEENYEIFKETIGKRIENQIEVEYAFQKLEDIPNGYSVPESRVKPWGTGHAILSVKDLVHENFAIINADDFYGRDAFQVIGEFLQNSGTTSEKEPFAVVGYEVSKTITENGSVKRGVCETDGDYLTKLIESLIVRVDGVIKATPLDGSNSFDLSDDSLVSMNLLGFTPKIFTFLEDNFTKFFEENKNNLATCEYLIPEVVYKTIQQDLATVRVLHTTAKWYGITYREDKEELMESINKLIENGEYPQKLWK